MEFFECLHDLDKSKENIIITILTGKNIGDKIILSNKDIVYKSNDTLDWKKIISYIPENKKSQIITANEERYYIEFIRNVYNVVVCGAGHISMSIIQMCKMLDLPVTVIDDRITFINNAIKEGADKVICKPFEEALSEIKGDNGTFFIVVTRGHRYDQECLKSIIQKENAYVGMIGSKLRVKKVLDYLEEDGIERDKLDKVYTPIGLKIGAETPAEISVSIMAEIIEVKNKVKGTSTYSKELMDGVLGDTYKDIPKAMITLVSRKGSAPRDVGTKMLVLKDGTLIGTIGGGCVESNIRQTAFSCMDNHETKLVKVDMTGVEAEDDGMVCGGIVELFVEPIK